ncbi:hypothetical protein BZU93_26560 [Salmonella enterica subsp. enterica]|nr:hypothetical protein [Salmonella enterica subsp. enterica serovar Enteritidis]
MPAGEVVEFRPRGLRDVGDAAKASKLILLLQGPVGPFFRVLQKQLESDGHETCRITFNPGDRYYSGKHNCLRFAGTPGDFSDFLTKFTDGRPVDAVILFGAMRPHHQVARHFFAAANVPVICLEEGYQRPGFITAELGGNNAHSPIAGRVAPRREIDLPAPKPASTRSAFNQMARYAASYYIRQAILSSLREHKGFHKRSRANLVREAAYWVRNYYRRMRHSLPNMRQIERLLEVYDKRYYLIPFQVSDDAQLTSPAARGWSNELLALKTIESFARNAPADHRLVFKIHPLERGHSNAHAMVAEIAGQFGVAGRVDVIDTGSMGLLARHSAGMITINSTSGLSAIYHGVPLGVLGKAIYGNRQLCSLLDSTNDIDRFWCNGKVAKQRIRHGYLHYVARNCLLPGDFYLAQEQGVAVHHLLQMVKRVTDRSATMDKTSSNVVVLERLYG